MFKIIIVLAFLFVFFLIGVYIGKFHSFPFASNPTEFGDFGSFVGGVIGVIISFAGTILIYVTFDSQRKSSEETITLLKAQLQLESQPNLQIEDVDIHIWAKNHGGIILPMYFTNSPYTQLQELGIKQPLCRLVNLGSSPAKNLEYKWEFDLEAISNHFQTYIPTEKLEIKNERGSISIKLNEIILHVTPKDYLNKIYSHSFLLPYNRDSTIELIVSTHYLELLSIFSFLSMKKDFNDKLNSNTETNGIDNFPKLYLVLRYRNLLGEAKIFCHELKFELTDGIRTTTAQKEGAKIGSFKFSFFEQRDQVNKKSHFISF
ncbi:MAG: hypothetical protein SFY32_14510 [Bacteroidota bacterium]|nr:hypothetical protein [Bacteroidota bacterium]